jgi:TolA-binding protein
MEKPEATIHPLDYLLQGLESSEKVKISLVNMIEQEERRIKDLQAKIDNLREIIKANQENGQKLLQIYEQNSNIMPLVSRFIGNLIQLSELASCKTIEDMVEVARIINLCQIPVAIQL